MEMDTDNDTGLSGAPHRNTIMEVVNRITALKEEGIKDVDIIATITNELQSKGATAEQIRQLLQSAQSVINGAAGQNTEFAAGPSTQGNHTKQEDNGTKDKGKGIEGQLPQHEQVTVGMLTQMLQQQQEQNNRIIEALLRSNPLQPLPARLPQE